MDIFTIILIAISLAMDCFAVSIANGASLDKLSRLETFKMASIFCLFQSLMLFLGWAVGLNFKRIISEWDHWVAFILLLALGAKMIYEGWKGKENENKIPKNKNTWKFLLMLAVATSLDSLATGIMFVPFPEIVLEAIVIVGLTSFIFTIAGNYIGCIYGKKLNFKPEILGGVILILVAIKILLEDAFAF